MPLTPLYFSPLSDLQSLRLAPLPPLPKKETFGKTQVSLGMLG